MELECVFSEEDVVLCVVLFVFDEFEEEGDDVVAAGADQVIAECFEALEEPEESVEADLFCVDELVGDVGGELAEWACDESPLKDGGRPGFKYVFSTARESGESVEVS